MVWLQSWSFGERKIRPDCPYSQVHLTRISKPCWDTIYGSQKNYSIIYKVLLFFIWNNIPLCKLITWHRNTWWVDLQMFNCNIWNHLTIYKRMIIIRLSCAWNHVTMCKQISPKFRLVIKVTNKIFAYKS